MADQKEPTQVAGKRNRNELSMVKIGHYIVGAKLGAGTFGTVKIGKHETTEQEVAIKILDRKKMKLMNSVKSLRSEMTNLYKFRHHPHIIQVYEILSSPTNIFIIMELAKFGDLCTYLIFKKMLHQNEARHFFQQIICAVDFCHSKMIIHRDLKPENIFLDMNMNVKIGDFGFSKLMVDGEFVKTCCGSLHYTAPELLCSKLYVGPEVDVWSCGVILYVLLFGILPFNDSNKANLCNMIKLGVFSIPEIFNIDDSLERFLRHMIEIDPVKRATLEDVKKNEWFQKDLHKMQWISENPNDQFSKLHNKQSVDVTNYKLTDSDRKIENSEESDCDTCATKIISLRDKIKQSENISGVEQTPKMTRWKFGLKSTDEPSKMMPKVFFSLKILNYDWKILDPFHLIVRKYNQVTGKYVKLSLQLYQTSSGDYLLDFKSGGEPGIDFYIDPATEQPQQVFNMDSDRGGSQTMEFLEMCLAISEKLAQ